MGRDEKPQRLTHLYIDSLLRQYAGSPASNKQTYLTDLGIELTPAERVSQVFKSLVNL
jgi:hypothetical protein